MRQHVGGRDTSMGYDDPGDRAVGAGAGIEDERRGRAGRPAEAVAAGAGPRLRRPPVPDRSQPRPGPARAHRPARVLRFVRQREGPVRRLRRGEPVGGGCARRRVVRPLLAGASGQPGGRLRTPIHPGGGGLPPRRDPRLQRTARRQVGGGQLVPADGRALGVLAAGSPQRCHGRRGREAGRSPRSAGRLHLRGARTSAAAPGGRRGLDHRRLPPGARRMGSRQLALHGHRELGASGRPSPTPPRQRVAGPARPRRPLRLPVHGHARAQAPPRAALQARGAADRRRRRRRDQRGHGRAAPARDAAGAPAAEPAPAAVPADRALSRHPRVGRRAGRAARADGRHVLGAVEGPVVLVRRPPRAGRHPAREPGGTHHRACGRGPGRVTHRRGGVPRGCQAPARRGRTASRRRTGGTRLR